MYIIGYFVSSLYTFMLILKFVYIHCVSFFTKLMKVNCGLSVTILSFCTVDCALMFACGWV